MYDSKSYLDYLNSIRYDNGPTGNPNSSNSNSQSNLEYYLEDLKIKAFEYRKLFEKIRVGSENTIQKLTFAMQKIYLRQIFKSQPLFDDWMHVYLVAFIEYQHLQSHQHLASHAFTFGADMVEILHANCLNCRIPLDGSEQQEYARHKNEMEQAVKQMSESEIQAIEKQHREHNKIATQGFLSIITLAVNAVKNVNYRDALQEHLDAECEVLVGLKATTKADYLARWEFFRSNKSLIDLCDLLHSGQPCSLSQLEQAIGLPRYAELSTILNQDTLQVESRKKIKIPDGLSNDLKDLFEKTLDFHCRFYSHCDPGKTENIHDSTKSQIVKSQGIESYLQLKAQRKLIKGPFLQFTIQVECVCADQLINQTNGALINLSIEDFKSNMSKATSANQEAQNQSLRLLSFKDHTELYRHSFKARELKEIVDISDNLIKTKESLHLNLMRNTQQCIGQFRYLYRTQQAEPKVASRLLAETIAAVEICAGLVDERDRAAYIEVLEKELFMSI